MNIVQQKPSWVIEVIDALKNIQPQTKAIKKAVFVFEHGQGFFSGGLIHKIFFWRDSFLK